MSRPKKNNFSESVKNLAGRSVAFRCCFPGCNRLLISRKESTGKILNIAEYAHIVAASPGGSRFDPSISSEVIKSSDNCIVLCSVHHHIIDNDPDKYPSDVLRSWKAEAEERTRQEMLLPNNYKSDEEIEALFSFLLDTGDYDVLSTKLDDFKDFQNHTQYEIVLRYKILLRVIFRREILSIIELYVKLGYKNIDNIVIILLEFDCKTEIQYVYNLIKDEKLKKLALELMSKNTDEIIKDTEIGNSMKKIKKNILIKYMMNYLFSVLNQQYYIYDKKGNMIDFCNDNYYYEFVAFVLKLRETCLNPNDYSTKDYVINKISKYIDIIDNYKGNIKLNIYRYILMYFAAKNSDMFESYYNRLSNEEQNEKIISDVFYGFKIKNKSPIKIDEILIYSERVNDYKILIMYLVNNPNIIKEFIEEHKYLLKKQSCFLLLYMMHTEKTKFEKEILNYKNIYLNDFLYNCILWNINIKDLKLKEWCISHEDELSDFSIELYLDNLILAQENTRFFKLIKNVINADLKAKYLCMFQIYNYDNKEYDTELLEEYIIINKSKLIEGINHNMSIIYWNYEEYDKAFKCLYKEIDNFSNAGSLQLLFKFRLDRQQYIEDKYFNKSLKSKDYCELIYAAEVYYHNNKLDKALDYYEKALITGANNKTCLFRIFELSNKREKLLPSVIDDNTAVNISNNQESKTIIFHRQSIIDGINCGNSEWCDAYLYSTTYRDFAYKSMGDIVSLNGSEYVINKIEDMYAYYSKLYIRDLESNPNTIIIDGSIEEIIKQIKDLTQRQYNYQKKKEEDLIKMKDSMPISVSSKFFFADKIFYNIAFLLKESSNKFMNNLRILNENIHNINLLFYYDALFVLYNIYEQVNFNVPDNYCITDFVKNRIVNEINDELNRIKLDDESLGMNTQGEILFFKFDNKDKNRYTSKLIHFKDFIEKFNIIQSGKYVFSFDGQTFEDNDIKMEDEKSILSIADGNNNFAIVSENQFFNTLCDLKKITNIGITQILDPIVSTNKIFDIALLLKRLNYNNYFTYKMYLAVREDKEKLIEFMNYSFETESDNNKHIAILQAILYELRRTNTMDIYLDHVLIAFLLKKVKF